MKNPDLLFLSDSYPYSVNYEWKRLELKALTSIGLEVDLIPFTYKQKIVDQAFDQSIQLELPTLGNHRYVKWYHLYFLCSVHAPYFLKEFFKFKVYKKKEWFNKWFLASLYTYLIYRSKPIKDIRRMTVDECQRVIVYSYWAMANALVLPRLAMKFKKVIIRAHGYDLYSERQGGYIPYQHEMLKTADVIACISEDGRRYLEGKYADLSPKLKLYYLGVDVPQEVSDFSNQGIFHMVTSSRVIDLKRLDRLVKALPMVKGKLKWTHLGDGPDLGKIKALAKGLKPDQYEVSFEGWLNSEQLKSFYENETVNVFVNLSWSEGLPVSIMEAISYGIPIIATDVGGTREIVDSTNGKLLNKDFSDEELVSALEHFMEMPLDKMMQYRKSARSTALEKFDFSKNSSRFINDVIQ
ncbi:MAG: glycosyltransferase [Vicingaceae bacterium]